MVFNLIYWSHMGGKYFLVDSIFEKMLKSVAKRPAGTAI